MDRFLIRIRMGYPSRENEKEILRSQADAHGGARVQPVMEAGDVMAMQESVAGVRVDDSLLDYALEIIEKTRQNEQRLILGGVQVLAPAR